GGTISRRLYRALDPALGAGGRLLAARDHTAATIAAIRQQADQHARAAASLTTPTALRAPATPPVITCPHCHQASVLTLTRLPPASLNGTTPPLPPSGKEPPP
ncbi:MAG: hypothetical protein ACRDNF_11595, partial [Streptosporangiaceae bacterium]